jgi:hypothetical protein
MREGWREDDNLRESIITLFDSQWKKLIFAYHFCATHFFLSFV